MVIDYTGGKLEKIEKGRILADLRVMYLETVCLEILPLQKSNEQSSNNKDKT